MISKINGNIVLLIICLISFYKYIQINKHNDELVVKSKFISKNIMRDKKIKNLLIVSLIVFVVSYCFLTYAIFEEFIGTKSFRDEYGINIFDIVNQSKLEEIKLNLDGDDLEWGNWAIGTLERNKKIFSFLVLLTLTCIFQFENSKIRLEKNGVRNLKGFKTWSHFKLYYIDDIGNFCLVNNEDVLEYSITIDKEDYFKAKDFLNKQLEPKEERDED